jgi:hypothetical protein
MSTSPIFSDTVFFKPAALTSAGTTSTFVVADSDDFSGQNYTFQTTVSSIGTNVVVRYEGSLDGTNFWNLNSSGDTTITTNTTVAFVVSNTPLYAVRCRLVSISTGTPSVTFVVAAK